MPVKTGDLRTVTLCFTGIRWFFANPADVPTPQTPFSLQPVIRWFHVSNMLVAIRFAFSECYGRSMLLVPISCSVVQRCTLDHGAQFFFNVGAAFKF
jgi:hypothetical protein